eukprot:2476625-Lingulodinium_polyedra.AAC.1
MANSESRWCVFAAAYIAAYADLGAAIAERDAFRRVATEGRERMARQERQAARKVAQLEER